MKKVLLFCFVSLALFADDIQVFTANTMNIKLDPKSTIIEILYCKTGSECVKLIKHDDKENRDFLIHGAAYQGATAIVGTSMQSLSNLTLQSTGASLETGAVGALAALALLSGTYYAHDVWEGYTKDYEYRIVSYAKNSKGEETLLATLIVSNDELADDEVKEMVLEKQKELLVKGK